MDWNLIIIIKQLYSTLFLQSALQQFLLDIHHNNPVKEVRISLRKKRWSYFFPETSYNKKL